MKIVVGVILLVFGAILAYLSILLRLIDIILIFGIFLVLVGVVLFILGVLSSSVGRKISFSKNVVDIVDAASNDLKNQNIASNIKDSVLGSNGISSNGPKRARSSEKPILKPYGGKYQNDSASLLGPTRKSNKNDNRVQSSADLRKSNNRNSNKSLGMSSNKDTNKSNNSFLGGFKSKEPANPKAVFNIPNSSAPKEKTYEYSNPFRSKSRTPHNKHEILVVNNESNRVPALRDLNFTPNYDRPMRVTRRPRRKSEDTINLNNVPKRTLEGSRLVFEDNSYLELEKEPSFPKPKSFRTFEDVAEDVIVPIHVDDINNIANEGLDSNYVNVSYAGYDNNSNSLEYDYSNSMQEPVHIVEVSQKPIIQEQVIQEIEPDTTPVTIPGTTLEDQLHADDFGFNAPDDEFVIDDGNYDDDYIIVEHGNNDVTDNVPYDEEFIIDNLEDLPAEEENSKPLVAKPVETINPDSLINSTLDDFKDDQIKFNPKKPETLPIPKLLNSYVICEKGMLTSLDAFEEVATHAKSELLLEAPDIRDMGEVFLSALTKVNSKVIIQEFDKEDLSYVLLISSLIKSGVQIRTAPFVGSFNLIGDLSHALIISNDDSEDMEYGAVYDDEDSVKDIKKLFEASWNLAKDLDI